MVPINSRCLSLITFYLYLTCAAERDFQFNDDLQVTLAEPQDEIIKFNLTGIKMSALATATTSMINGGSEINDGVNNFKTHRSKNFYSKEVQKCPYSESKIMLSLVLKSYDWKDIVENKKNRAINKLSKFFAIPKEYLKMESISRRDMHEMLKRSIKRGPNKCSTNRRLGKIEFMIGCGQSSYFSISDSIINQIAEQMKDGSIDEIAGIDFGWWIIWRKGVSNRVQRSKRDTEGSGEYDYTGEYDYDDGDDDDGGVTDIPTTPTHAHRHHHGAPKPVIPESPITKISINSVESHNMKYKKNDFKPLILPTSGESTIHTIVNIDDEIVKNEVSKLESVISKTIENTQKIKDLSSSNYEQHKYKKGDHLDVSSTLSREDDYQVEDIINDDKIINSGESILPPSMASSISSSSSSALLHSSKSSIPSLSSIDSTTSRIIYITTIKPKINHHLSTLATNKNNFNNKNFYNDNNVIIASTTETNYPISTSNKTTTTTTTTTTTITSPTQSTSSLLNLNSYTSPLSSSSLSSLSSSIENNLNNNNYYNPKNQNTYYNSESVELNASTEMISNNKSTINNNYSTQSAITTTTTTSTITTPSTSSSSSTMTSKIDNIFEQNLINLNEQSTLNSFITTTILPKNRDDVTTVVPLTDDIVVLATNSNNSSIFSRNNIEQIHSTIITPVEIALSSETVISSTSAPTEFINPSTTATTIAATDVYELSTTNAANFGEQATTLSSGATVFSPTIYPSTISSITFASSIPNNRKDDEDGDDVTTDIEQETEIPNHEDILLDNSTVSTQESSTAGSTTVTATIRPTPPATTSTTIVPSSEPTNLIPIIKNRIPKLPVTAGKAFTFRVPEETFFDHEDSTNLKLELLDFSNNELKPNSWIQYNSLKREIYGLPLEDHVSHWQFKLVATDSGNESVAETIDIAVQQYKGHRSVNHEISIGIKFNKKYSKNIDWQLQLLRGISESLNDQTNPSPIIVREVRQNQDPSFATFSYYNETLPKDVCPTAYQLNSIIEKLRSNLNDSMYPDLSIKTVNYQLVGNCEKTSHHVTTSAPFVPHITKNYSPVPRNQVDRVNATIGHLLVFKVPPDTFYDPEDTTDLKLSLLTMERNELNPKHWLQFDSKNQEFYGIPKVADYGSEEYLLVAEDHEGLTATDALVVVVNHAPKREFSVYFKAKLGIRYEQFNAQMQRKFVERVARLFNDPTPQYIQVRSITQNHDSEETIVNFYNTTLHRQHNRCPEEEIEMVRSVWFSNSAILRDRVKKNIGNEFNLSSMQIIAMPIGSCHSSDFGGIHRDIIPIKTEEANTTSTFKDDYILTFVLPAVIILLMILLASIIACVLHRRRLTGKMELGKTIVLNGDEEERKSFRSKGIPVIFQDELDEKPEIGNKSPIILKDEKPPLLPPSYNSTNIDGDNDCDEYVPPPAVVVGNREIRGKSPVTPSYRKPPPYVSP
ncbi:uncharacterized protein LOC129605753 isoform X2 [Condylostylus longicornis]|uniref:uncharacterized protein LOC129605753 isoform X2 n=1 Tax=Condylostylus longicornis TaxID=2530218 RepID=UPI00244E1BA5|nr:uncharacterized protein LOC129605753 isoform X2 [Condylostylus longicornis]